MKSILVLVTILICWFQSHREEIGVPLPQWQPGMLDLHHISTGRGNAAFYIFPDGTSALLDAGDMSETNPRITSPRNTRQKPDDSKPAGEWIVDYIRQFHPKKNEAIINYAIVTHFHDDHYGEIDSTSKKSKWGHYYITGLTEVGEHIKIEKYIDRAYPDYNFPSDMKSGAWRNKMLTSHNHYDVSTVHSIENLWKFLEIQSEKNGLVAEQVHVGSMDQIHLKYNASYPATIRNIYGNGWAWTGWGKDIFELTPHELLPGTATPGENSLSIGIKISFGKFDYFTGGDIAGNNTNGSPDFSSVEAQVALVIGAVDIATLNHHGNRDSQSTYYVRSLKPKVWIQQTWSSDHPGDDVLRRITSKKLYPGERHVFATDMLEANELVIGNRIQNAYSSLHGHVVVRVFNNGKQYMIYVLNDNNAQREVIKQFGPFESR